MQSTKQKGDEGEIVAIKYLQKHDYKIIDTNYKFGRFGEIDIISTKNSKYYFIEVKLRTNNSYGDPIESITKSKLRKLEKSIFSYCMKYSINIEQIEFQIISIFKGNSSYKLEHYKNISLS